MPLGPSQNPLFESSSFRAGKACASWYQEEIGVTRSCGSRFQVEQGSRPGGHINTRSLIAVPIWYLEAKSGLDARGVGSVKCLK